MRSPAVTGAELVVVRNDNVCEFVICIISEMLQTGVTVGSITSWATYERCSNKRRLHLMRTLFNTASTYHTDSKATSNDVGTTNEDASAATVQTDRYAFSRRNEDTLRSAIVQHQCKPSAQLYVE